MKTLWCFLCILLSAATAGCPSRGDRQEAGNYAYTDKMGRTVHVTAPVRRAVVLNTYELVSTLDAWSSVAAVGKWACNSDLVLATFPGVRSLPVVGVGTDVNMESLVRQSPDVVLTWSFRPELVRFMEKNGLSVIAVYPDSISELYDVLRMHGKLFGREERAERAVAAMERVFSMIRDRAERAPSSEKVKALWVGSRPNTVAGGTGLSNEMISLIGALNPAEGLRARNADVSMETIISWNPDLIFIWGNAPYSVSDILAKPALRGVAAVRNRRVYKAPAWSTWSPRLAPVVLWMAMKAYPGLYRDISFDDVADRFFREVFGIPYGKVRPVEE